MAENTSNAELEVVDGTKFHPLAWCPVATLAVCTTQDGKSNGQMVAWWTSCDFADSKAIMFAVDINHMTNKMLDKTQVCTLSLLSHDQKNVLEWLGYQSGNKVEKFGSKTPFKYHLGENTCPIIEGSVWTLECNIVDVKKLPANAPDTVIYFAEATKFYIPKGSKPGDIKPLLWQGSKIVSQ